LALRKHHLAVHGLLERAAARRDQRQRLDPLLVLRQEFFRRTDGSRGVVSLRAVLDADADALALFRHYFTFLLDD
jgi:hypothetical protein